MATDPKRRDMLQQMLRAAQRAVAKEYSVDGAIAFITYVTGQVPAPHHVAMLQFALDIIKARRSGVVLAPRGSGKTTILNTGLLPWLIALLPDIRIGLLSQKAEKAEAMSGAIQSIVSESPEFIEIFGNLRGTHKWTAAEWLRKDSPHAFTKDRTMIAGGADQSSSVVSKRFDLIFCDDILDDLNTYNIDRREKLETWFWKTLKPAQAAEGCAVLVVGTRWVEDDLYQRLIENNGWDSLVIPALTVDEGTGEEKSYWPEVWPLDRLYKEREDVGWDNFACSYLNDISGSREGTIFQRDWWKANYFTDLPTDRQFVFTMGMDLAMSEKQRADWTTIVIVAKDDRNEHYVLFHDRIKTADGHRAFLERCVAWAADRHYPISRIVIENNQAQALLVRKLQDETGLPIVGRRADVDKVTRARATAARYESRRVHHHESIKGRELETELVNFPKSHDDLVDALGLAMDLDGSSGSFAAATPVNINGAIATTGMMPLPPNTLIFRDGPQEVPAHVQAMLEGIPYEQMTWEEAVAAMNQKRLNDYMGSMMKGMLSGRR